MERRSILSKDSVSTPSLEIDFVKTGKSSPFTFFHIELCVSENFKDGSSPWVLKTSVK